jgi:hypothetical protein
VDKKSALSRLQGPTPASGLPIIREIRIKIVLNTIIELVCSRDSSSKGGSELGAGWEGAEARITVIYAERKRS